MMRSMRLCPTYADIPSTNIHSGRDILFLEICTREQTAKILEGRIETPTRNWTIGGVIWISRCVQVGRHCEAEGVCIGKTRIVGIGAGQERHKDKGLGGCLFPIFNDTVNKDGNLDCTIHTGESSTLPFYRLTHQ